MPVDASDGEKQIDIANFSAKVHRVLSDSCYRNSAARVAESMRQFGGARHAADKN
jgi:UDP:flavonoid glycosyltransferase YjiC (YdhE family)